MAKAKEDENVAELPILVKADVQGSAEAINQAKIDGRITESSEEIGFDNISSAFSQPKAFAHSSLVKSSLLAMAAAWPWAWSLSA